MARVTREGPGVTNPWQPGYVLDGRYELVKLIGAGAMGVVWRVFDREWSRDLALKMPQPVVFESQMLRDRFVREAETWIGLGVHPHIVQCWFVSEVHGVPCLFLDYLTGGCLKSWISGGHVKPGDWGLILEIVMQVAEGLAYAHSKGVIHRDVKPENLMIRGDERVCVTDFGIVKTLMTEEAPAPANASGLEQEIGGNAAMTAIGSCLGTPMYGAPEQWGTAERVAPPADVYALGIILYEMCCGRRPFDTDEEKVAPMTLINRHLSQRPPDPREFRADMPVELARLCLKMLAKDPADRPQEMMALREFLSTIHHKLTGKSYRPAAPLHSAQSPDVLNNQAFSLASLGKIPMAVETLRRGLQLDPGHPECLYNLVQLEKRHGNISHLEALRRLKQARAHFPRALLLTEEGMPAEAYETLKELNPAEVSSVGLYYRAMGDALMYLRRYDEARQAYTHAHELMPKDGTTELRGNLSVTKGKHPSGAIFFPSPDPLRIDRHSPDTWRLLLDDSGAGIIAISTGFLTYTPLVEGAVAAREERVSDAGRLRQTWLSGKRLAIADSKGFEFRLVPSLKLLARRQGRILACSPRIDRLVTLEHSGPCLFVVERGQFEPILMEGQSPDQGPLLAAFDPGGQQLALLLPSGQLAGLDQGNRAVPQRWPALVEDHKEARCMALTGDGAVIIGFTNGLISGYDIARQTLKFTTRLPQSVSSLEVYGAGAVVARTQAGYHVLDPGGEVLLYGEGPLALDPESRRAVSFFGGRLVMSHLSPFHVLRRWTQEVEAPQSVAFSGDGRFGVALSGSGESVLWEFDEPHRVYQRELLMSPGRGYTDILTASQQFEGHLSAARQALERHEPSESLRHLQRARKVPGYGQGREALDFCWQLLDILKRDQLEAVWERLSLKAPDPGDLDLSLDGRRMLYSSSGQAFLAEVQDGSVLPVWKLSRRGKLRLLRFVELGERSFVVIVDASGEAGLHTPSDGRLKRAIALPGGPIGYATLQGSLITYRCKGGGVGQFDLNDGSSSFRDDLKSPPRGLAPWQPGKVLVTTSAHLGVLDLRKPGSKLQALNLGVELTNPPCFTEHLVERGYLILSFSSGTLHILDATSGRLLAALKHGEGNIVTSFEMVPELSVALTSTARGQLCFWDLRTGQRIEKFIAQRNGISRLRASHAGRYLLSTGDGGNVRLWETCWSALEARGDGEATWASKGKRAGLGRILGR